MLHACSNPGRVGGSSEAISRMDLAARVADPQLAGRLQHRVLDEDAVTVML